MFTFTSKERWFCLALLLAWSLGHASVRGGQDEKPGPESQAEKLRKVLDREVTLDFASQSFQDVVQHLKQKTSVNFTLDLYVLQQMGLGFEGNPTPLELKGDRVKLRQALQRMLSPYNLTFVILEDAVLITTEEMGLARQMRQRVNVNVADVPLQKALKDLARTTALNLVIDPRIDTDTQKTVTLKVDDATLETAARLLAELGGVKSVRLGNVLFVTSESRADKLRKEDPVTPASAAQAIDMVFPGRIGLGGIGVPPLGIQGRGLGGFGGIAVPVPPAPNVPPQAAPKQAPPPPPK